MKFSCRNFLLEGFLSDVNFQPIFFSLLQRNPAPSVTVYTAVVTQASFSYCIYFSL